MLGLRSIEAELALDAGEIVLGRDGEANAELVLVEVILEGEIDPGVLGGLIPSSS